jgi:hypothetical protein
MRLNTTRSLLATAIGWFCGIIALGNAYGQSPQPMVPVGTAVVDVTPDYPVRMVGYESRKTESEGIASPLKVRAMAIGGDTRGGAVENDGGPALLVAVDNCAVNAKIIDEVAAKLRAKTGLSRDRFVVCSTHTHCAPALSSGLDFIFGATLPADQRAHIERYTKELTDAIEKSALLALENRAPATLAWGQGKANFAANRRVLKNGKWVNFGVNPSGPVDQSLPVLRAVDAQGKVKAVLFGYACHCTTLGGNFNQICGEWTGYACDEVERLSPGAVAVAIIGCGADANPEPRRDLNDARNHGAAAGREVDRLVKTSLTALPGRVDTRFKIVELPLEPLPTRTQIEQKVKTPGAAGFLARTQIERLDRGESLPTTVPYRIQTWCFGDDLAIVFLAGEVVVDYVLRLKWETDADRLWVAAYSNDVPCYIPSRRVLSEGGYEADFSMIYYGQPSRLAPLTEDVIVGTVHELLPDAFDGPRRAK